MQNAGWKEGILKRSAEKELESGKPLSRHSTLYEHYMAKHAMSFYKSEFFFLWAQVYSTSNFLWFLEVILKRYLLKINYKKYLLPYFHLWPLKLSTIYELSSSLKKNA